MSWYCRIHHYLDCRWCCPEENEDQRGKAALPPQHDDSTIVIRTK